MVIVLTWCPEGRHRGEQQITDAVAVHDSTTPEDTQTGRSDFNKQKCRNTTEHRIKYSLAKPKLAKSIYVS